MALKNFHGRNYMRDKFFYDTNILVYGYINQDIRKQNICKQLLEQSIGKEVYISIQVLNEFYSALKKNRIEFNQIKQNIKEIEAIFNISDLTVIEVNHCLELIEKYNFSYWDSLIIASALQNNCSILYSEDMQHNQLIENKLTIINPFK